jgi:hypothetical protein
MSKIKTIFTVSLCLIILSCEKATVQKAITVEEMKNIVSQSFEMNSFYKISAELISMKKSRVIANIKNNNFRTAAVTSDEKANLLTELKQAKTRDDLKIVINKLNPIYGNLILENIEKQQLVFKEFLNKNPQFLKFSKSEKIEILSSGQNNYKENSLNSTLSTFDTSYDKVAANSDCMGDFNDAFNDCTNSYNNEVVGIYIGVLASLAGGVIGGGVGIVAGTALLILADNAWGSCVDNAGFRFGRCS